MLKNILNLKGVKVLGKEEQRNVKGGASPGCNPAEQCCYVCSCGLSNYFIYPGQQCHSGCNNSNPNCG